MTRPSKFYSHLSAICFSYRLHAMSGVCLTGDVWTRMIRVYHQRASYCFPGLVYSAWSVWLHYVPTPSSVKPATFSTSLLSRVISARFLAGDINLPQIANISCLMMALWLVLCRWCCLFIITTGAFFGVVKGRSVQKWSSIQPFFWNKPCQ